MQFTDDAKQTINDLLKSGDRDTALQFICKTYFVSGEIAEKLLDAFEKQYVAPTTPVPTYIRQETPASPTPPAVQTSTGCGGCLSAGMMVIGSFLLIAGIGLLAFTYFGIQFVKDEINPHEVTAVVTDTFPDPEDSDSVKLVIQYEVMTITVTDTSEISYKTDFYKPGDSLTVFINQKVDEDADSALNYLGDVVKIAGFVLTGLAILFFIGGRAMKPSVPKSQNR